MTSFCSCWESLNLVLSELDSLIDEAENSRAKETKAAIDIQRLFRGQLLRQRITSMRVSAICIARRYRGFLGRKKSFRAKNEKTEFERRAIFHFYAARIQTIYRGFRSRMYKSNFHARKSYIKDVEIQGEILRKKLEENLTQQKEDFAQREEIQAKDDFNRKTHQMHHLVSTKAVPGVLQAPQFASREIVKGLHFNGHEQIEESIRVGTKSILRSLSYRNKKAKERSLTKNNPEIHPQKWDPTSFLSSNIPSKFLSVQATDPYYTFEDQRRHDSRIERLSRVTDRNFMTVCRENLTTRAYTSPSDGSMLTIERDEYLEPWQNPYIKRGIPRSANDLDPRKTTLDKYPTTPFFLKSGGNQSRVYANDCFDVKQMNSEY